MSEFDIELYKKYMNMTDEQLDFEPPSVEKLTAVIDRDTVKKAAFKNTLPLQDK
jgi:hypothetical protein